MPEADNARAMVARWLYAAVLRLLVPAYLVRLWWRSRAEPLYRHAMAERLGIYRDAPSSGCLWLHAVSLGETRAAASLVQALRETRPGLRFVFTHGTATGLAAGGDLLQPGDRQTWLPVDTPGAVRRFLDHFRPALGVLMETEVWPSLLREAAGRELPVVLANARLSERSLRRGQRVATLLRPAMARLALALAQTDDDAARLRAAGVMHVVVCGNLKFDMPIAPLLLARGRAWRDLLQRPVVMAAATREGEETALVAAWRQHAMSHPRHPLLLVVPRHPQRFDAVADLLRDAGLGVARRSTWADDPSDAALSADAWLGDSMREMAQYYALADVALLGGSFEPLGGQNLIEAAACGCPLVMGPSTFNFDQAARQAEAAGAAVRAMDIVDAVRRALALLDDEAARRRMQVNANEFAGAHGGAAKRMAALIAGHLPG